MCEGFKRQTWVLARLVLVLVVHTGWRIFLTAHCRLHITDVVHVGCFEEDVANVRWDCKQLEGELLHIQNVSCSLTTRQVHAWQQMLSKL